MRKVLTVIIILLIFFTPAGAAHLDLAWDANTEPDLAGYRVYYGTASREYVDYIDVGNTTSYRLDGLLEGVMYYIAVTAYDLYGNRSNQRSTHGRNQIRNSKSLPASRIRSRRWQAGEARNKFKGPKFK